MSARRETYSHVGPICPHCEHEHRGLEAHHYDEGLTELECERCEKGFNVRVYTSTSWTCWLPMSSDTEKGTEQRGLTAASFSEHTGVHSPDGTQEAEQPSV